MISVISGGKKRYHRVVSYRISSTLPAFTAELLFDFILDLDLSVLLHFLPITGSVQVLAPAISVFLRY